jgi:hypothetical protein
MLTEDQATALAWEAIQRAGGTRSIYRNPRQAFSAHSRRMMDIDGTPVEIRYGENLHPGCGDGPGLGLRIHDEDIELLIRPPKPKPAPNP